MNVVMIRRNQNGFTLIELMIVVVVLAITATIALPNFQALIQDNRVSSNANQFRSALNTARSEAITRSAPVTVAAVAGDFGNGWCIHEGDASAGCGDDTRIRQSEPLSGVAVTSNETDVTFDRRGRRGTDDDFTLSIEPENCEEGAERRRQIEVNFAGRATAGWVEC